MNRLRNFHLPLPEELYRRLRSEAEVAKQPATVVARHAIEAWLRERRRAVVHEAIRAYAIEMAGTGADLDPALEAASLEHLAAEEKRARRARRRRR
jgi:predicted transcriptional regulator